MSLVIWVPSDQPDWSIKKVKIIKNSENHIFLLSQNELILLDVDSSEQNLVRILIGEISGLEESIKEIKIESWMNIFVIVVLTDENLHVFHTKKSVDEIRTEADIKLTKIQTIKLQNNFCQFEMIKYSSKDLFLVTYEIRNETSNNLM